jgi:hypothetical protein
MQKVTIGNYSAFIPQHWNDLTKDQLLGIVRASEMGLPITDFLTVITLSFLGLKVKPGKKIAVIKGEPCFLCTDPKNRPHLIGVTDIAWLSNHLEWLLTRAAPDSDGKPQDRSLNPRITINLIPEIMVQGRKWYGPADGLTNISFHEYMVAETHTMDFLRTADDAHMCKVIATLYRPADAGADPSSPAFSGDLREPFNDFLVEARANDVATLDSSIRTAIMLFYYGCRYHIRNMFPEPFAGAAASAHGNTLRSYLDLVTALSHNDVTKNEEIRRTNLYEVMISLQHMVKEANAMKKSFEKIKKP